MRARRQNAARTGLCRRVRAVFRHLPGDVMSKRAVFLDRDGTIVDDTGFIRRVEDVKLLPDAAGAVRELNAAGWAVIVITNQSGVARGLLSEKDVAATNQRMIDLLAKEKARVDAIYYCPHLPEGKVSQYALVCDCRKPRPGMLLTAAAEHDIDLASSVTIGDAPRDVEAGLAAGTRAILLTQSPTRADQAPDACGQASDLLSAVREVLELVPSAARVEAQAGPEAGEEEPAGEPTTQRPRRKPRRRSPAAQARRGPSKKPAAEKPEKEKPVSEEEKTVPVHRAPKEFVPEPEPAEEPEEDSAEAEAVREPEKPGGPEEVEAARESHPVVQCGRCGRVVSPEDVAGGKAYDRDGVRLCSECVIALQSQRRRPKEVTNEDIHRELQNICRALTYEKFSYWHVFGAIAQALAIGSIIFSHRWLASPEGLLWAIFFQLVALTFFILGRQ